MILLDTNWKIFELPTPKCVADSYSVVTLKLLSEQLVGSHLDVHYYSWSCIP